MLAHVQVNALSHRYRTTPHAAVHVLIHAQIHMTRIRQAVLVHAQMHAHLEGSRTPLHVVAHAKIHAKMDGSRIQEHVLASAQIDVAETGFELQVRVHVFADQIVLQQSPLTHLPVGACVLLPYARDFGIKTQITVGADAHQDAGTVQGGCYQTLSPAGVDLKAVTLHTKPLRTMICSQICYISVVI